MDEPEVVFESGEGPPDLEMLLNLYDRTEGVRETLAAKLDHMGAHTLARSVRDTFDPEELGESAFLDALEVAGDEPGITNKQIRAIVHIGLAAGFLTCLVQDIGMVCLAPSVDDTVYDEDDEEDVPTEEVTR